MVYSIYGKISPDKMKELGWFHSAFGWGKVNRHGFECNIKTNDDGENYLEVFHRKNDLLDWKEPIANGKFTELMEIAEQHKGTKQDV